MSNRRNAKFIQGPISHSLGEREWKPGDRACLDKWDATEPPWNQLGNCTVISTQKHIGYESGIMVTVRNAKGSEQELDSSWLEPLTT